MRDKFNNLTKEKQENIIQAAINEFGEKGYTKASTDTIANNAGIAKGSLFYYFGNKKNLYLYIVEYSTSFATDKIISEMEKIEQGDFYQRVIEGGLIKQRFFIEYPLHSKVIMDAFMNMPPELKEALEKLYIKYYTLSMKIVEDYIVSYLDTTLLKSTVTKEDAIFLTLSIFEALSKKYTQMYQNRVEELMDNTEELFKEYNKYVDIIKYGIYK